MPTFELISLIAACGLAWLWFDSLRARDTGIRAVRAACQSEDLQLLDDTVSIASLMPSRNDEGQMVLRRVYEFEYSDTGDNRRKGSVILQGARVVVINIGLRLAPADATLH